MGQALYRKYRSRKLTEVVGQDHITRTLTSALTQGRLSHAYLFSGPKGVGKTSVARIMAHEVNHLPYRDDSPHLDIIEIDAASNRRIDEIRDLRQKINVTPAAAAYKVYIIDEVHMLTREAFNALLKTLEEPPPHAIFILATTEPHKLPETIVSRTQHFSFKPVARQAVADHLKQLAKSEKIIIDDSALELLADYGEGSFRDSIGLLDQLGNHSHKINEKAVRDLIGLPPKKAVSELLETIVKAQPKQALELLTQLLADGSNGSTLAAEISRQLRQLIIESHLGNWAINLLKQLSAIPASLRPEDELEISLIEAAARQSADNSPPNHTTDNKNEYSKNKPDDKDLPIESQSTAAVTNQAATKSLAFKLEDWPKVVSAVKEQAASLYTALRLASPSLDGQTLTLEFNFPLHQKKVQQPKNLALIEKILLAISASTVKIECVVAEKNELGTQIEKTEIASPQADDAMPIISNIFPAAEMLES